MKRILVLLLAILMCMMCMNVASAAKQGDEVTIPITLNNTDAVYAKITVSYDTTAFEFVKFTNENFASGTTFTMSNFNGLPSGTCNSIILRVTDKAVAGKDYSVSARVVEAWTINETAATASASGGTVTIDAPVQPTEKPPQPTEKPPVQPTEKPPVQPTQKPPQPTDAPHEHSFSDWVLTKEPTYTEYGEEQRYCLVCGETQYYVVPKLEKPTVEPTVKPTVKPTEVPTVAPTEAPTAVPTEVPTVAPTEVPTAVPTEAPTAVPTEAPTAVPTEAPTAVPTEAPTAVPTEAPTAVPTEAPTAVPTEEPTAAPTVKPTLPPVDDSDDVPKTGDSHFVTSMFVMAAMAFAVAYLVLHVKSRKEN